jgi:ribonuclease Z
LVVREGDAGGSSGMVVILLGTGTPSVKEDQFGPSTLVVAGATRLLFDCGRGASLRIMQAGEQLQGVRHVFLTHLHSDHVVGLPDLWLTGWEYGREKPLRLFGPADTSNMAAHLEQAFTADIEGRQQSPERLPASGARIQVHEVREGVAFDESGVRVTAFKVDHGPFSPALGYRVDYRGHSVVISGDTRPCENLIKHAERTDVLIHNAWVVDSPDSKALQFVSSPEEAGDVFGHVKPRLAVITHYSSSKDLLERTQARYGGKLVVGKDLTRIEVGSSVSIYESVKTR